MEDRRTVAQAAPRTSTLATGYRGRVKRVRPLEPSARSRARLAAACSRAATARGRKRCAAHRRRRVRARGQTSVPLAKRSIRLRVSPVSTKTAAAGLPRRARVHVGALRPSPSRNAARSARIFACGSATAASTGRASASRAASSITCARANRLATTWRSARGNGPLSAPTATRCVAAQRSRRAAPDPAVR